MPDLPLEDWMVQLDAQLGRSPRFFDGRPVVLDVQGLAGMEGGYNSLIEALAARAIRVIGIEGADDLPDEVLATLPPLMPGGRTVGLPMLVPGEPEAPPPPEREPPALVLDRPVRSGQSVAHTAGDVTVIGSVASGSEVIAGGSIHVYGTLRGRAIAGLLGPGPGNVRPRIFCRRLEAELLAIDGVYRTADEMDPKLMGRAVQAWLEGDQIRIAALD